MDNIRIRENIHMLFFYKVFTSLNLIYSVANVLNILYTKTSKIANFSTLFSR